VSIEHVFLPWEDVALETLVAADDYALQRKRALVITIEPWTWTRDERNTPQFLQRGIAEGYYDANMRSVCQVIGTLKSPVTVRWGHEMEVKDNQFIWSNWQPDVYISAYRRMIEICRAAAPQINVMWSPLGEEGLEKYYPGDDVVDLVGVSIFDLQPWEIKVLGKERTYEERIREAYGRVVGFGKPVVVAELGYSGSADYVESFENAVRVPLEGLENLVGVIYFDQKEPYPWPDDFGFPDWTIPNRVIQ
ncbi:MAG: beta-mannosidase, partial [Paracoccaceae bacterium]|nr:beta-mannosidase [Paracoccaceae bacterium]